MTEHLKAYIYIILAGIGFGFLGIFGRWAFESGLNVEQLLSFRFLMASFILWIGLFFYKKELIVISVHQILISIFLGMFGYAVFSTLYFKAIMGLSVSLAALLLFTFPALVNVINFLFYKIKLNSRQIVSLIMTMTGLVFLVWGPVFIESWVYVVYALLAAVSYSLYVVVSGRTQKYVNPLSSSLYVITAAAVTLLVYGYSKSSLSLEDLSHLTAQQILIIMGISVICTIIPITLFLKGLQTIPSGTASIIVTIEPVIATIAGFFLLNESLTFNHFVGMSLIVFSLITNRK